MTQFQSLVLVRFFPPQTLCSRVGSAAAASCRRYLVEALLSLHAVHAARERHTALPSVLPFDAVGRRRGLAERDLAVGGRQAWFVPHGGGSSARQSLLPVVDQLSAAEGRLGVHAEKIDL